MAELLLDIDHLDASGDGVARHRGRTIAVPFTIPGERVRARLDPSRPGGAVLVEVVRPSPDRVQPGCTHFGACGGCSWQHIAYPAQLRLKTALLDRLVHQAVPDAPQARPMLAATPLDEPWHYRQKVHFVFASSEAGLVMGHYARGSREVMAVRDCPVHDERGNAVAFRLFDAYAKAARQGLSSLKSLVVRTSIAAGEIMATLVVTGDSDRRVRTATRAALAAAGAPSSFHVNVHPRDDGYIFGTETKRISGTERLREDAGGVRFLISPASFFQTNVRAADILVRLVLEAVPAGVDVLDLYAGAGLFALPLARRGSRVTAVEANRAAVADGEASLRVNRIEAGRCRFVAAPVRQFTARAAAAPAVVLDPPREGCERAVVDAVFGRLRPATAVYVSCNPETLARDLRAAVRHGYAVASLQPVDMFPHTPHIETVATLTRPGRRR